MLKLSFLEIILRTIPENLLFVLVPYVISTKEIKGYEYVKSVFILSLSVVIIRVFPISYGVHTLLNLILLVILLNSINHIEIGLAIKSVIVTTILLLISEGINLLGLNIIIGSIPKKMLINPLNRIIMGMPSIIIFGVLLFLLFKINKRKKQYEYN